MRLPATPRAADAPIAPSGVVAAAAVGPGAPLAPGEPDAKSRVALAELALEVLNDLCEAAEFDCAQMLYVQFDCDPLRAGVRPRERASRVRVAARAR
jgi:hypothetical protein